VPLLAAHAAQRGGESPEPFVADVAAAVDADAVAATLQQRPRRLHGAKLAQVAAHVGFLEIGEQRCHRLVAAVRGRAGVLGIRLIAYARRVVAQLGEQRGTPLLEPRA